MLELLAIAACDTGPTTLDAWVESLRDATGRDVVVTREPPDSAWVEIVGLQVRGYVVLEGAQVGAINFELTDPESDEARAALERSALALRWELYDDDDDDDDGRDD